MYLLGFGLFSGREENFGDQQYFFCLRLEVIEDMWIRGLVMIWIGSRSKRGNFQKFRSCWGEECLEFYGYQFIFYFFCQVLFLEGRIEQVCCFFCRVYLLVEVVFFLVGLRLRGLGFLFGFVGCCGWLFLSGYRREVRGR